MASQTLYDANVLTELGNAFAKTRKDSPCAEAIMAATEHVVAKQPIYDTMEDIVYAMKHSTNENVLFALSQAVAWIGPMGE